jgi:hypothetical protein
VGCGEYGLHRRSALTDKISIYASHYDVVMLIMILLSLRK